MIFAVLAWAVIVVFAFALLIHVGFEVSWPDSFLIAAVIVSLCLDGWLLWHLQLVPALQISGGGSHG